MIALLLRWPGTNVEERCFQRRVMDQRDLGFSPSGATGPEGQSRGRRDAALEGPLFHGARRRLARGPRTGTGCVWDGSNSRRGSDEAILTSTSWASGGMKRCCFQPQTTEKGWKAKAADDPSRIMTRDNSESIRYNDHLYDRRIQYDHRNCT